MFTRRSGGKKKQTGQAPVTQPAGDADHKQETSTGLFGKATGRLRGDGADRPGAGAKAATFESSTGDSGEGSGLAPMQPLQPPGHKTAYGAGDAGSSHTAHDDRTRPATGDAPRIPQRPPIIGTSAAMPSAMPQQAAAPKGGTAPRPPVPPEPARQAMRPPQPVAVSPSGPNPLPGPNPSAPGRLNPAQVHPNPPGSLSSGTGGPTPNDPASNDPTRRMPEPVAMTDLPIPPHTPGVSPANPSAASPPGANPSVTNPSGAKPASGFEISGHGQLIVGKDIELNGKVKNCDVLIVEGTVEATLVNTKILEVAAGGVFRGTAPVGSAEISGLVEGDLIVDGHVLVRSTGVVNGNIEFGELEIERGGRVHGTMLQFGEAARKRTAAADARTAAKARPTVSGAAPATAAKKRPARSKKA